MKSAEKVSLTAADIAAEAALDAHIPASLPLSRKGWRQVRFGDVISNVNVNTRKAEDDGYERYVGLDDIDPQDLRVKRWGNIADGTTFTRVFRSGQVLFGKRRAYQRKVAMPDFDGICSGDILVFEAAPDLLLPDLLPFIVQSEGFFQHALGTSAGSLSPRTKWSELATYRFALPPIDEQRRVAEIAHATNSAIASYEEVARGLSLASNAIFEDAVSSFSGTHSRILGDALEDIVAGKSPECSSDPASNISYGVLKVSAVSWEGFRSNENKALLLPSSFVKDYEVKPGDLLVTRCNALLSGVGRACLVDEEIRSGLMLSDKTLRLVVNSQKATKRYLLQALHRRDCRRYIEGAANGTEAKNISQAKLKAAPIPLPSINIQRSIEVNLRQLDDQRAGIYKHISALAMLRQSVISSYLQTN